MLFLSFNSGGHKNGCLLENQIVPNNAEVGKNLKDRRIQRSGIEAEMVGGGAAGLAEKACLQQISWHRT